MLYNLTWNENNIAVPAPGQREDQISMLQSFDQTPAANNTYNCYTVILHKKQLWLRSSNKTATKTQEFTDKLMQCTRTVKNN